MAKTASRIDRNKICADLTIVISKDISGHFIFFLHESILLFILCNYHN